MLGFVQISREYYLGQIIIMNFSSMFFVQFKLKCVLTFSTMHYKANLAQTLLGKPYTEKI